MIKLGVRKNGLLKFAGFVGALFIIIFGNIGNFLRTIDQIEVKVKK